MSNPRNQIQEYCQKYKIDFPIYDTSRIGGEDHKPIWKSTTTFKNKSFEYVGVSKKETELAVSKMIVDDQLLSGEEREKPIEQNKIARRQKVDNLLDIKHLLKYKTILLVDGENTDFNPNPLLQGLSSTILILIFAAKNTTKNKIFEHQERYEDCYVFLSSCVGKDAADHLLTFYCGMLNVIIKDPVQYYVFTKDHYGEYMQVFMRNCKFICSLDEIT